MRPRFCKEAQAICEELFDERHGDLLEALLLGGTGQKSCAVTVFVP